MSTPPLILTPPPGRKAQAYSFIVHFLVSRGYSPAIGEVAAALGVGPTRAKALVKALVDEGAIHRAPGTQRAISVPNLPEAAARLRAGRVGAYPKGHLPIVAILEHNPAPD